jgi:hypothetical protein
MSPFLRAGTTNAILYYLQENSDMRKLLPGLGFGPENLTPKNSDMRKSKYDKGMTLCRYFGGVFDCAIPPRARS